MTKMAVLGRGSMRDKQKVSNFSYLLVGGGCGGDPYGKFFGGATGWLEGEEGVVYRLRPPVVLLATTWCQRREEMKNEKEEEDIISVLASAGRRRTQINSGDLWGIFPLPDRVAAPAAGGLSFLGSRMLLLHSRKTHCISPSFLAPGAFKTTTRTKTRSYAKAVQQFYGPVMMSYKHTSRRYKSRAWLGCCGHMHCTTCLGLFAHDLMLGSFNMKPNAAFLTS